MIRLESSGSDCTVEAGFRENSVYSTYTRTNYQSATCHIASSRWEGIQLNSIQSAGSQLRNSLV